MKMIKKIHNKNQNFVQFVNNARRDYLTFVEKETDVESQNALKNLIKEFEAYHLNDVMELKSLNIDNLLFVGAFNKELKADPDINEYVAGRVLSQNEEENLHLLAAFLAKGAAIENLDYEYVFALIEHLCEKEENQLGYCFEYPLMKEVQAKVDALVSECTAMVHEFNDVEDYVESKRIQKLTNKAVSTSTLNKADYLGWKLLK